MLQLQKSKDARQVLRFLGSITNVEKSITEKNRVRQQLMKFRLTEIISEYRKIDRPYSLDFGILKKFLKNEKISAVRKIGILDFGEPKNIRQSEISKKCASWIFSKISTRVFLKNFSAVFLKKIFTQNFRIFYGSFPYV